MLEISHNFKIKKSEKNEISILIINPVMIISEIFICVVIALCEWFITVKLKRRSNIQNKIKIKSLI